MNQPNVEVERLIRVNLRVTPAQLAGVQALAREKYEGNLSQAMRRVLEAGLEALRASTSGGDS